MDKSAVSGSLTNGLGSIDNVFLKAFAKGVVGAASGAAGAAIANGDIAQGALQGTFIELYNHGVILLDSLGAYGLGHLAILVGDDKRGWVLYSKDGGSNNVRATFKTHDEFYQSPLSFRYDKGIYIITTPLLSKIAFLDSTLLSGGRKIQWAFCE